MRKILREGKVLLDWSQNDDHKTTVCAYSLRAHERPYVSTPLSWKELEKALQKRDVKLLQFEAEQVLERVREQGDLFAPVATLEQELPEMVRTRQPSIFPNES
jgi:bifunctional non-homologous end joining protein LigD